jgi:DNA-binding NarL/FixJ family response regulator
MPLGAFLAQAPEPSAEKLTPRQREVLQLLAEGRSMREVASMVGLTPRTVAYHKYTIMHTLGLKNSAELVQYAVEHRLVAPKR